MTQEELDFLMEELAGKLRELSIPLSRHINSNVLVNTRAKRRLGCCYYRGGEYAVEVSAAILDDPEKLRETLCHELLHTCPGCRDHGEKWKALAERVNAALGTNIQRLTPGDPDPEPLRRDEVKYILRCADCGKEFRRRRMCKLVKSPWRYRCQCGGKLKRIM